MPLRKYPSFLTSGSPAPPGGRRRSISWNWSQAHLRYLLAIGELSQGKAAVSSTQVARVLQVSRPSVTRMLAVLAEKDLVTKERYGKIILTETGAALAHQLQAGLRDLERRLPALGLDLDREETAAVAGALASVLPEHCLREKLCTTESGGTMGCATP